MIKPAFCMYKKDADQLRDKCIAIQRLCFWDLVKNPEDSLFATWLDVHCVLHLLH